MNSLHSGLQNKDTYYLNQFYLRISNIDNSYKKHPSTGHRTAANSILRGGWQTSERPPFFETPPAHWWALLPSTPAKHASSSVHVLNPPAPVHMTTLTDQYRREHTPYSIHSSWRRGRGIQVSFHLTHSTNVGCLGTKLTSSLPTDVDVLWMQETFVRYLLSLLSAHSLTKATGWRDTSRQVKKYPFCTTVSARALSFSRSY